MIRFIKFTIPGEPKGKGRPRFSRQGQVCKNLHSGNYSKL